jgi:hypothetical protein
MKASDPIRSLIKQIIVFLDMMNHDCPAILKQQITALFGQRSALPSSDQIFNDVFLPLHQTLVEHMGGCTYVIDGLDDCSQSERQNLLEQLVTLQQGNTVRLLLATREAVPQCFNHDVTREVHLSADIGNESFHLNSSMTWAINHAQLKIARSVRQDISTFVDWKIERKSRFARPLSSDASVLDDVKNALNDHAHLM